MAMSDVLERQGDARPRREPERQIGPHGFEVWYARVLVTPALTRNEKAVIGAIAMFDWHGLGKGCTASWATLAAISKLGRTTVRTTAHHLARRGLIEIEARQGYGGTQASNRIRIRRDRCAELPGSPHVTPMSGADTPLSPGDTKVRSKEVRSREVLLPRGTPSLNPNGNGKEASPPGRRSKPSRPRTTAQPNPSWSNRVIDVWRQCGGSVDQRFEGRLIKALKPVYDDVRDTDRLCYGLAKFLIAGKGHLGPEVFARDWRKWVPGGRDGLPSLQDLEIEEFVAEIDWARAEAVHSATDRSTAPEGT